MSYPAMYDPKGCDVFVWMEGEEVRACGISPEGKKAMERRVVPEQGYAIIMEMPDEFMAQMSTNHTVGVALDSGKVGYIVPNLS